MSNLPIVGFVGVGRLGLPLASALIDAGYPVRVTTRGRADEIVARGAQISGDGSVRAVAEASDVVITCLPSVESFNEVFDGEGGLLHADRVPPVIEMSTLPLDVIEQARVRLAERGAGALDAPVSGTPLMVEAKIATIYASGEQEEYERWESLLAAMAPTRSFVGEFGTGTKMKFVAQFLATINVTAAVQAMAYAQRAGLDLHQVVETISASPGAVSGQFKIRAPLIAAGQFDGRLVTVDMTLKDVDEVLAYGREIGAPDDLLGVVRTHYGALADGGEGGAEPAKLFLSFANPVAAGA